MRFPQITRAFLPLCLAPLVLLLTCQAAAQGLEPGDLFADELRDGGHGPKMMVIPAGSFRMGCVSGLDCLERELPVHTVTIPQAFAVSTYEITFEDYDRFLYPNKAGDYGWGRGSRPVIYVTWTDAKKIRGLAVIADGTALPVTVGIRVGICSPGGIGD